MGARGRAIISGADAMNEHEPRRAGDRMPEPDEAGNGRVVTESYGEPPVMEHAAESETVDHRQGEEPRPRRTVTMGRGAFIALMSVGVLAILALGAATTWLALDRRGTDDPVVATVNGEAIRRSEYDKAVAQASGEEVLDGLIAERLIETEARKRNVTVDDGETAREIADLKEQFGGDAGFQAALAQQGLNEADLTRRIRLSAMLRSMVGGEAQVTDQEVDAAYRSNAERYAGQPEAQVREQIKSNLQEQKQNAAAGDLLEQLRTQATIETKLPGKS
jgi:FKBP-type peptidyl-prolyl cis-trans isomerase (trigger factor)